jgi:hypothetical protein
LILDFEFDQHLGSHKHVINIIMWFRDMECYMSHGITLSKKQCPTDPDEQERMRAIPYASLLDPSCML